MTDWFEHYKAVKNRIRFAAVKSKPPTTKTVYRLVKEPEPAPIPAIIFEVPEDYSGRITLRGIAREVAEEFGVKADDILGRVRIKNIIKARHEFWLRCTESFPGMSLCALGRLTKTHHTTLMNGIKNAKANRENGNETTRKL